MSITQGVFAQFPQPEAHDRVLDNNPVRSSWNLKVLILRRGENRATQKKPTRGKDKNQQQTQPTYDAESANRTRAILVGSAALPTAPCLLPNMVYEQWLSTR